MKLKLPDLNDAKEIFQRGVMPGAFLGAVVGLLPGILLVLVLGGGNYGVGLTEVLSFFVMSLVAGTVLGVLLGGVVSFGIAAGQRAFSSLRSRS